MMLLRHAGQLAERNLSSSIATCSRRMVVFHVYSMYAVCQMSREVPYVHRHRDPTQLENTLAVAHGAMFRSSFLTYVYLVCIT